MSSILLSVVEEENERKKRRGGKGREACDPTGNSETLSLVHKEFYKVQLVVVVVVTATRSIRRASGKFCETEGL